MTDPLVAPTAARQRTVAPYSPGQGVQTPSGVFTVGSIKLPPRGAPCPACGAPKVRQLPDAQGLGQWCSGCGRRWLGQGVGR